VQTSPGSCLHLIPVDGHPATLCPREDRSLLVRGDLRNLQTTRT
jgi:hypothetical protein